VGKRRNKGRGLPRSHAGLPKLFESRPDLDECVVPEDIESVHQNSYKPARLMSVLTPDEERKNSIANVVMVVTGSGSGGGISNIFIIIIIIMILVCCQLKTYL